MKKIILSLILVIILFSGATPASAQTIYRCGTDEAWQQIITSDSSFIQKRQQLELQIDQYIKDQDASRAIGDDSLRIIPVVFHILHEGGPENIANAQVYNALKIMNEDFRRTNADTVNTPVIFKPVAADTKIEFRLAKIDPNGNCTDGINRVYTHRTKNFNNATKSVIDWPTDKYLNIWVAKSIGDDMIGGNVIGYAQFPNGPPETDGIVMQYDFVGDTLTGQAFNAGREADHEIGHYLNLLHISGCVDTDSCVDTPPQSGSSFGCPVFPHISCGNNGDMTDNYMAYSDGRCKDLFTEDQKKRMRATLDVARFNLWQQSNLKATGTDDSSFAAGPVCPPDADFLEGRTSSLQSTFNHLIVCPASTVYFKDNSTKGIPTSWNWSFPGGNPAVSTLQNPAVVYSIPGIYHVMLTTSNANGNSSKDVTDAVIVDYSTGTIAPPYTESFEGAQFPPAEWHVYNDDGGPAWQRSNRADYTGSYCASIQNYESWSTTARNSVKELITPSFDLSHITSPVIAFRISYGKQYSDNHDSLSFGATTNCTSSWVGLKNFNADSLSLHSAGFQPNDFAPSIPSQWGLVSIPLNSSYAGKKNVRFRFYFNTHFLSNNLYIDDFNVNGVVGINAQENAAFSFDADPNPASESFMISYNLKRYEDVVINLYDLRGRLIKQLENKRQSPGEYETRVEAASFNLSPGVYILKMVTPDGVLSKKLVYSGN